MKSNIIHKMALLVCRNAFIILACCLLSTWSGTTAKQPSFRRIISSSSSVTHSPPPVYQPGTPSPPPMNTAPPVPSYPTVPTAPPPPAPSPTDGQPPAVHPQSPAPMALPSYPPLYNSPTYPPPMPPAPSPRPPSPKPPPPTSKPPPPLPPSDPCADCQFCLDKLQDVAKQAFANGNPWVRPDQIARIFYAACVGLHPAYIGSCSAVSTEIIRGTTYLSARPGMMCSRLGACKTTPICPKLQAQLSNSSVITGSVDLCTAEGVVGGNVRTLPSDSRFPNACRSRTECTTFGDVCYMSESGNVPRECFCDRGSDICYNLGTCTPFCNLTSTIRQVGRLNAGARSCTPGSDTDKCPEGYRCAAMATGYKKWECNRQLQALESQDCRGRCLPSVLNATSAQLTNSGGGVNVMLNAYAGRLSNEPCEHVFDNTTVEVMGGPGAAQCSTNDNYVYVRLPATATIEPKHLLVFRTTGSALVAQVDPNAAFGGNVTMENCRPCSDPHAIILGPSTISDPCIGDDLVNAAGAVPPIFDASSSYHPSGRPAWVNVNWSLNATVGMPAGRDLLQTAIDRTNNISNPNNRLQLKLTMNESTGLPPGQGYMVRVTFTSWLNTVGSVGFTFDKAGDDSPPAVKVVGPNEQSFLLSNGLRIAADAGQVCGGKIVNWLWTSLETWAGIPAEGVALQQLFVAPPVQAAHGQDIKLRVNASFEGANSSAYADVTMAAVGSNPIAKLKGRAGKVPQEGNLTFDATRSRDPDATPDTQQLSFIWDCRREDYPNPCFSDFEQGDQDSVRGVWSLPSDLLEEGIKYTITVTVNKDVQPGASALSAVASLDFELAKPDAFPRGSLSRECSTDQCAKPHNTADDLVLMLVIEPEFSNGTKVTWDSEELPAVTQLDAAEAFSGTFLLTIPSTILPTNVEEITIIARMSQSGYDGFAFVTVPLNAPPFCTLDTANPSKCFEVVLVTKRYPQAIATISAAGWGDYVDGSNLTYEYGTVNGSNINTQQLGGTMAVIQGLYHGNVSFYGCAVDSSGARQCATVMKEIEPPDEGFNPSQILSRVNLTDVAKSNSRSKLFGAANQCGAVFLALRFRLFGRHRRLGRVLMAADVTVSDQTIALVQSVLGGTNLADIEQVKLALSSVINTANSAAGLLTTEAADVVLSALDSLIAALSTSSTAGAVSTDSATQVCSIIASSLPSFLTADSSRQWLNKVLTTTTKLAAGLGKQATPGAGFLSAGSGGIYVAGAATALSGDSFASATVRSGPTAGLTTSARRRSTLELLQLPIQQEQPVMTLPEIKPLDPTLYLLDVPQRYGGAVQEDATAPGTSAMAASARRSLAGSAAADAEAVLTVTGSGEAANASSYSIGLTQIQGNLAINVLTSALGSLPSGIVLVSGLVDVTWSLIDSTSTNSFPNLDGTNAYITLKLPTTSLYDGTKLTACLQYDKSNNTIYGSLGGLTAAASPAAFEDYNAATGLVKCLITAAGSYIVALGTPPPPPPSVAVPPPPSVAVPPPPSVVAQGAPAPEEDGKKDSNTGAIVGGVVGGVGGVILVVGVAALLIHRRRRQQQVNVSNSVVAAQVPPSQTGGQDGSDEEEASAPLSGGGGGAAAAAGAGAGAATAAPAAGLPRQEDSSASPGSGGADNDALEGWKKGCSASGMAAPHGQTQGDDNANRVADFRLPNTPRNDSGFMQPVQPVQSTPSQKQQGWVAAEPQPLVQEL